VRTVWLIAVVLLLAPQAHANSAYPTAGQLVIDPADPTHMVLRTTFGMVMSHDAGASWQWVCEGAAGYIDEDPPIAVPANGAIVAAISAGVSITEAGDACRWSLAPGIATGVRDVSAQREDASIVVAVTTDAGSGASTLWESLDHGASWTQAGVAIPALSATTLDVAPTDPMRVYVAGTEGVATPVIARTDDRGQSWTTHPIPASVASAVPYLSAIDPVDPDIVYVRMHADPGRLMVSQDGGVNWVEAFGGIGPLRGFTLSPDGQTVLVSDVLSVYRAPASSLTFIKMSDAYVQCLTWGAAGLYACGHQYAQGFFLGLSTDEGASFTPLLHMHCIRPLACDAGTSAGDVCPAQWTVVSSQLAIDKCAEGGGGAGGAPSAGGAGGTPGGGAPGMAGSAGEAPPPADRRVDGCGCRTASSPATSLAWLALIALGVVRRRRSIDRRW
jgi:MYXO-CTERM domain-containing protein